MESAEQAAVSAPRDGTVTPKYFAAQRVDGASGDGKTANGQDSFLSSNRHFDHLAVNVTLSTVLLPAGVNDAGKAFMERNTILEPREKIYLNRNRTTV